MTRRFRASSFFNVFSVLPFLCEFTSIGDDGLGQAAISNDLNLALVRREGSQGLPQDDFDGPSMPADLAVKEDAVTLSQPMEDTSSGDFEHMEDMSSKDMEHVEDAYTQLAPPPRGDKHGKRPHRQKPAPRERPALTKNTAHHHHGKGAHHKKTQSHAKAVPAKKEINAPLQPTAKAAGFHLVGLSICTIALAGIFSVHWRSLESTKETSIGTETSEQTSMDSHVGGSGSSSSEPPGPTSNEAYGQDEPHGTPKGTGPLELTNEVAWQGLQFFALLFSAMALTRLLVCDTFNLQCDEGYTLQLFFRQDFHKVVLEISFLFVIGRLAASSCLPVNSLAFAAVILVSALMPSWWNELSFMKHSLSMYQMACSWTAMTWVFAFLILGVIVTFGALHLFHFLSTSGRPEQIRAIAELVVILCIFVLPRAFESGFHMHHWYAMWLLALFCRNPTLWSRGVQAFLIGGYINGIAVYGRDPVLACQAAYDMSYSQQCNFLMMCTWNTTSPAPIPGVYTPPNWRTCSGDYA